MLLEKIHCPKDLKSIPLEKLPVLAGEIRQRILEVTSKTGGHVASSLGTVELTIALHYCLDAPRDKIIFDVGHQAYAHKILTERNKGFSTLRQYQGISGFPSKDESEYDPFTTGHSSTAVSLALGLACARDYCAGADKNFKVAAVIGDGSLSGGLCFEGLNNAGHLKKGLLVVLNTNELSIAPNVGALSTYLNKIISLPVYNRFKDSLEIFVKSRMPKGSRLIKLANKFEEGLKGLFIPGMFFEELGFRYFGPFDGHNMNVLVPTLNKILQIAGPKLLHVVTKKGKGYLPAEGDPVAFHGTQAFDIDSGEPISKPGAVTYTGVFREKLVDLAATDSKILAITAAMPEGTGLDRFRDLYPERFFDVGIAEAHAVCFAAGLARAGFKPVVAVYSTFLQRAYDQIIEEAALQNLGIVFAVDRAGIVGEDGVTHQGIFDIAFLRSIPNVVIMAPKDGEELKEMLEFAFGLGAPVAIRYPRDRVPSSKFQVPSEKIQLGRPEILREGRDAVIFALGSMVLPGILASEILAKQGIGLSVINARFARPLDVQFVREISRNRKFIFSAEEGIVEGGFGSAVSDAIGRPVEKIGLPCSFIVHGKRDFMLNKYGLTPESIAERVRSVYA